MTITWPIDLLSCSYKLWKLISSVKQLKGSPASCWLITLFIKNCTVWPQVCFSENNVWCLCSKLLCFITQGTKWITWHHGHRWNDVKSKILYVPCNFTNDILCLHHSWRKGIKCCTCPSMIHFCIFKRKHLHRFHSYLAYSYTLWKYRFIV